MAELTRRRRYSIFYVDEGGFRGSDENNEPTKELYYLGIIDIFTYYSSTKRLETAFRSIRTDRELISAVDPDLYAARFLKFTKNAVQSTEGTLTKEEQDKLNAFFALQEKSTENL